jgi:hypothetical protein
MLRSVAHNQACRTSSQSLFLLKPAVLHGSQGNGQTFATRRLQSTTTGSTLPTTAPPASPTTGTTDNTAVTELESKDVTVSGELPDAYECSGAPGEFSRGFTIEAY